MENESEVIPLTQNSLDSGFEPKKSEKFSTKTKILTYTELEKDPSFVTLNNP